MMLPLYCALLFFVFAVITSTSTESGSSQEPLRYVPLGDSYTIGHGAGQGKSWPELLAKHFQQEGVDLQLIVNPARSGWTSRQLLEGELPVFTKANPTFTTILIGANDIARGIDSLTYKANLKAILDRVQAQISNPRRIVLLTVPDFTSSPAATRFGTLARQGEYHIKEFNAIIKAEAAQRGLPLVDLFAWSRELGPEPSLFAADGLHPSAKGYAAWEKFIYQEVNKLLISK